MEKRVGAADRLLNPEASRRKSRGFNALCDCAFVPSFAPAGSTQGTVPALASLGNAASGVSSRSAISTYRMLKEAGFLPAETDHVSNRTIVVATGTNWIGVYDQLCMCCS
jgi:hypothetical protein